MTKHEIASTVRKEICKIYGIEKKDIEAETSDLAIEAGQMIQYVLNKLKYRLSDISFYSFNKYSTNTYKQIKKIEKKIQKSERLQKRLIRIICKLRDENIKTIYYEYIFVCSTRN